MFNISNTLNMSNISNKPEATHTQPGYKISKETAAIIDAIKALSEAEEKVFEAYKTIYPEETTHRLYNETPFEPVRMSIAKHLYNSIQEHMCNKNYSLENII